MSAPLITGVPLKYRVVIEGEISGPGLNEGHVHGLIQSGLSFCARLASCNRSMEVHVAPPGAELPKGLQRM